ncbi:unnamed protein product [Sphagnum jensenii]|uniref:HD domain-containing protein n=1 Tax=Sphagnum jensenii TaxID=128206 RepID=A0ABP0V6A1_9BRYO
MMIERHAHIEDILKQHRSELNLDFDKYRHHVYRVLNFTTLLHHPEDKKDMDALAIAAAYHDIGIWTAGTLDYLAPSIALALAYVKEKQPKISAKTVEEIISNHHKVTPYRDSAIVEAFRKADMIDLSLGIISHGISGKEISEIYDAFPGEWFHTFYPR